MRVKQSGLILPFLLLFLIVLASLLLRAGQTVNIESLLNRYLQDEAHAFLAAESALSQAQNYLMSDNCHWPGFDLDRTDGLFTAIEEKTADQIDWLTQAQSLAAADSFEHLAQPPAYSIQYLLETTSTHVATTAESIRWFRIISRGVSTSSSHVVLLESLLALRYNSDLEFASADKTAVFCCWQEVY